MTKHPGRTPSERRVLDAIGCGERSPRISADLRDRMLRDGLIVRTGWRVLGLGWHGVRIAEYEMPKAVHAQWREAVEPSPDVTP